MEDCGQSVGFVRGNHHMHMVIHDNVGAECVAGTLKMADRGKDEVTLSR